MNTLAAQFDVRYPAFHFQVSLAVPLEGVTAIFGPSGCGKTTFLRCLAGLERSSRGVVRFGNTVWQDEAQGLFLPISQRPIGYVFQDPRLFPHLSIRSNLEYGFKRTASGQRRLSFDHVLDVLGLHTHLDRRPHELSGGEQQRVAIGRALLTSPTLLLMDEPLSSLDGKRKREILPFIQRLDTELKIPIIYVSHSLQEVLQLATTLVMLKDGHVMAEGPLANVVTHMDWRGLVEDSHIGAIIDTVVEAHDLEFRLTRLRFGTRHLSVPHQEKGVGEHLRVQILSRDVSIVTSSPTFQSSVLNVLEAMVTGIGDVDSDHPLVDITLDIGCPLLATITRKSLAMLNLHPGQSVYVQIKAVALCQDIPE
ncbi:MAG: molybdenum ABC transporter ATP-binding protein [Nitrospirales bacterium]|nr:molybdenum ABC transporter ATP-binding protein [Nitrospirales bacterium]